MSELVISKDGVFADGRKVDTTLPKPVESHGFNFHPIPKWFKVWDRHNKTFRINNSDGTMMFDIAALTSFFVYEAECGMPHTEFDLIQSTNLFDKDGNEIFEGSIVENHFINKLGFVYYDEDVAGWRILYQDGTWDDLYYVRADITVTGHILSNPELMEENNV